MSVVLGSRKVAGGPTVGYQGDGFVGSVQGSLSRFSASPACLKPEGDGLRFGASASEESSSIGLGQVSSDEDEEEEEVQSGFHGGLACLDALEESLPIKRGLSNYFSGKSKSFASLSDVASQTSVKGLAKAENPFNKRRRILVACETSWSRGSSLNASMPQMPPHLEKTEEDEEDEEEEEEDSEEERRDKLRPNLPLKLHSKKLKTFGSSRSYSLSDLRHA